MMTKTVVYIVAINFSIKIIFYSFLGISFNIIQIENLSDPKFGFFIQINVGTQFYFCIYPFYLKKFNKPNTTQ